MENIIEHSRILAKFMGGENYAKGRPDMWCFEQNPLGNKWLHDRELNYHTDWNRLMQVVQKIESLGFEFIIAESRANIAPVSDKSVDQFIIIDIIGTKIEAVYNACVEFVKWYNSQPK